MSRFESGMESMVDMYIYESTSLLEQLDNIAMKTESNNKFDDEDINEIFRIMHTIKGSSAMMGLENMSTLAHSIEDMFFIIREEKPVIESVEKLYDIVFSSSDLLKAEIELLQDDDSVPTDFSAQMEKIAQFVEYLKTGRMPGEEPAAPEAAAQEAADESADEAAAPGMMVIRVFFEDNCEMENLRALLLVNKVAEYCSELEYEPKNIETDSQTAKAIAENGFLIKCKTHDDDYQHVFREIEDSINVKSYEIEQQPAEPVQEEAAPVAEAEPVKEEVAEAVPEIKLDDEPKVQAAPVAAEQPKPKSAQTSEQINNKLSQKNNNQKGKQSLISVNLNKLDQLLDMVGEIVIAEAMVTSNPDLKGLKLDNFQKASRQLRKLTDELQDIVMSIRMVPLSGVFNKMTRIVRDMKVKLNKDVDLVFQGEETEVDKSIIDQLNDPLMHMVRNSMDHGIEETAEERVAKGKPAKGTIQLSAYNSSGEVIIVVSDDGGGINTKKVLEKAEAHGLLYKPAEEYSDKEICNMIMLPGFSTNTEVTEFSGRGVGMDVVKKGIEKIGGTVSVESKYGVGTNFVIRIPLSLAIVDGIEVSVGDSIFTIPINSIKEFIKLKETQLLHDTSHREIVKIRNKCYPLIRLHECYGLESKIQDMSEGVVVLVESEGKSACILVDELIGEQQVVVKPFPPMLNRYNVKQIGMSGCSILGDGSITIILDVGGLLGDN